MVKNIYISTGQKQVMHTLWVENIPDYKEINKINKDIPNNIPIRGGFPSYNYIKNLSMDEATAIKEAKAYVEEHGGTFIGVENSPRFKRAGFFDAFGMHFTQRRKQGKTFFMATEPSQEFWDAWKQRKEDMRNAGFSVSKFRNPMKKIEEWYVFYRGDN